MDEPAPLLERVAILERQVGMYEKLFQTFSSKLDHHFKKYDMVVNVQQQQIKTLSDVISTLLNDQHRHSGILKEKMGDTLKGITTTASCMSGTTDNTNRDGQGTNMTPVLSVPIGRGVLGISRDYASVPQESESPVDDITNNASPKGWTSHEPVLKEENKKRCMSQPENFQFLVSPQSVLEVWQEYTNGLAGLPSVQRLESTYGLDWRRDPATNRTYYRRKVLCKAIENGLAKGYRLEQVIDLLEDQRTINDAGTAKHPISWLYSHQNIPSNLK
ncbi:LANO_0H00914g1_1 [Lachancea nothofagi CBS 11611]|uniref:LANO_0H00914g1_1 n=1 Tax=Lachancea nothofagi CBS 11611 TaxID=1266666 RepID=A0A1G4KKZ1_9SACH|nr:LANO_0H00914g1_1 [Lachancea nothofagi CBS 11611]